MVEKSKHLTVDWLWLLLKLLAEILLKSSVLLLLSEGGHLGTDMQRAKKRLKSICFRTYQIGFSLLHGVAFEWRGGLRMLANGYGGHIKASGHQGIKASFVISPKCFDQLNHNLDLIQQLGIIKLYYTEFLSPLIYILVIIPGLSRSLHDRLILTLDCIYKTNYTYRYL